MRHRAGCQRLALGLPKHPDEHRSERPVLLAVDQQLAEGSRLGVAPELADPLGPVEVGSVATWSLLKRLRPMPIPLLARLLRPQEA